MVPGSKSAANGRSISANGCGLGQLRLLLLLLVTFAACLSVQVAPVVTGASVIGGGIAGGGQHAHAGAGHGNHGNQIIITAAAAAANEGHLGGGGGGGGHHHNTNINSNVRQQVVDIEEEAAAALVKVGDLFFSFLFFFSWLVCLFSSLCLPSPICLFACLLAFLLSCLPLSTSAAAAAAVSRHCSLASRFNYSQQSVSVYSVCAVSAAAVPCVVARDHRHTGAIIRAAATAADFFCLSLLHRADSSRSPFYLNGC